MKTSKGPPVFDDINKSSCFDWFNKILIKLGENEQLMGFYSYYNN